MKCRQKKVQWKYLPDDIWNLIFLNYCDFMSLVHTRVLQTEYVKECTEGNNMKRAIKARNFKNMKWIYEFKKGFRWRSGHFTDAASYGDLEIMKWMKTKGSPWSACAFSRAAIKCDGSNFEILEWLGINNCPWNERTFEKSFLKPPVIEWLFNYSFTTIPDPTPFPI